jgi:hypothetical protein
MNAKTRAHDSVPVADPDGPVAAVAQKMQTARAVAVRLCIVLGLFLAFRIALCLGSPWAYDHEESKPAIIARAMAESPRLPVISFYPTRYEGGLLLYALLARPLVWLFGPKLLVCKILALTTATVFAYFSIRLVTRVGGDKLFWPAALVLIAGLPGWTQTQSLSWANFNESSAFGVAAWYFWVRYLAPGHGSFRAAWLVGLLCGLGFTVHFGFLVTIAALGLYWFWREPSFPFSKAGVGAAVGLASGLFFFLWFNLRSHWTGVARLVQIGSPPPEPLGPLSLPRRVVYLFGVLIPQSFHFGALGPTLERVFAYLVLTAILGSGLLLLVSAVPRNSRSLRPRTPWNASPLRTLFPLLYLVIFAVAVVTSGFPIGLHPKWGVLNAQSHVHLLVGMPYLVFLVAFAPGSAFPKLGWLAVVSISAASIIGTLALFEPSKSRPSLTDRDVDSWPVYFEMAGRDYPYPDLMSRTFALLSPPERNSYRMGLGWVTTLTRPDQPPDLNAVREQCPPDSEEYCLAGVAAARYFQDVRRGAPRRVSYAFPTTDTQTVLLIGSVISARVILPTEDPDLFALWRSVGSQRGLFSGWDPERRARFLRWLAVVNPIDFGSLTEAESPAYR